MQTGLQAYKRCVESAIDKGACKIIAAALCRHKGHQNCEVSCSAALATLFTGAASAVWSSYARYALEAVLKCLRRPSAAAETLSWCCATVAAIVTSPDERLFALKHCAAELVVRAMLSCSHSYSLQQYGCNALTNLLVDCAAEDAKRIVAAGACVALVNSMRIHMHRVPLCEYALAALSNLEQTCSANSMASVLASVSNASLEGVVPGDILKVVVAALRGHPNSAELHRCGRRLLRRLPAGAVIATGAPRSWLSEELKPRKPRPRG